MYPFEMAQDWILSASPESAFQGAIAKSNEARIAATVKSYNHTGSFRCCALARLRLADRIKQCRSISQLTRSSDMSGVSDAIPSHGADAPDRTFEGLNLR
jgi:hypothetical protein